MKKSIFFLLLLLACSINIFAQTQFTGKVTEILDGRTVVVTADDSKQTTFQLLYIEVPEAEQPLAATIVEYLKKITLNKTVKLFAESTYSQGLLGRMYLNDVDIAQQMLRNGAAWYNLPEFEFANVRNEYQKLEAVARKEKVGIWGIDGMKPAWEFRAEQYARKVETRRTAKANRVNTQPKISYPELPEKNQNVSYIDINATVPKGFAVVGVGYLKGDNEKLVKIIKKPQAGDLVCNGYEVPSPFALAQSTLSKLCPFSYNRNNANYIETISVLSKTYGNMLVNKVALALRMYRISGNYSEFEVKAREAISEVNQYISYVGEGNLQTCILLASQAMTDAMLVRSSRNGVFGAQLSGSALIALNDKYGLNDVSAYRLDDEIINVAIRAINKASAELDKF